MNEICFSSPGSTPTSVTPSEWRALLAIALTRTRSARKVPGGR